MEHLINGNGRKVERWLLSPLQRIKNMGKNPGRWVATCQLMHTLKHSIFWSIHFVFCFSFGSQIFSRRHHQDVTEKGQGRWKDIGRTLTSLKKLFQILNKLKDKTEFLKLYIKEDILTHIYSIKLKRCFEISF